MLIYSLLIGERYGQKANPDNLLVFIMDDKIDAQSFVEVKYDKDALDKLIMCRNELAKWEKQNKLVIEQSQQGIAGD